MSTLIDGALQHLVSLTGGCEKRLNSHLKAYESPEARRLGRIIRCIGQYSALLRRAAGPGPLPYQVTRIFRDPVRYGILPLSTPFSAEILLWVDAELRSQQTALGLERRRMRAVGF